VKSFLFTGGEALLRNDIRELLDDAARTDPQIDVSLFTNGLLMDEAMFFFCRERGVGISTSLQGLRTHGTMTGTEYGYRKTLELISLGRREDWPLAVSIVVTKENRDEIRDVFAAAALCGASFIQLGPMLPEGRGATRPEWLLSREEWESVKGEIRAVKDFGVPYVFCDEMICTCRSHAPEIEARFPVLKETPCEAGREFGVIGPDGKYRKCIHSLPLD
jgi:MoaA/NifB/PqqE/SkfB family radical SAM enzyme